MGPNIARHTRHLRHRRHNVLMADEDEEDTQLESHPHKRTKKSFADSGDDEPHVSISVKQTRGRNMSDVHNENNISRRSTRKTDKEMLVYWFVILLLKCNCYIDILQYLYNF